MGFLVDPFDMSEHGELVEGGKLTETQREGVPWGEQIGRGDG